MIEASQVRLKSNPDDPYTWERLEEKEHLVSKKLSDLSAGQLKELCDGVNNPFRAIWKVPLQNKLPAENEKETVRPAHLWQSRV